MNEVISFQEFLKESELPKNQNTNVIYLSDYRS